MHTRLKRSMTGPKAIGCLAAFVALSAVYFLLFHFWERNSDDANSLIAASEILRGNPLLRGWQMPTDTFYFTDLVPAALLTLIFGLSPKLLFVLPALIWAATVCFFTWFTAKLDCDNPSWSSAWTFVCLGLPIVIDTHAMRLIGTAPMHISTVLFGGVLFRLIQSYWDAESGLKLNLVGAFVVALLGTFSDPFIVFVAIGPAIVVCAWNWLESVGREKCVRIILVLALSVILGRGFAVAVAKLGGVELAAQPIAFATFEALATNFALIARGLMMIFGADFTGRAVGMATGGGLLQYFAVTPITMFVRLIFVAGAVVASISVLRRHIGAVGRTTSDGKSFAVACLAMAIVLSCVAAFVSNQLQNLESSRYLLPVLLYGSVLGAVTFSHVRVAKVFILAVAMLSGLAVAGTMVIARSNVTYAGENIGSLAAWLASNGLHDGYGPYWSASATTLTSSGQVRVRAIQRDEKGLIHPYLWLADRSWFPKPTGRRFILVDKANPGNYTSEQAIAQFGRPSEIKQYSIYDVLVYDADKSDLSSLAVQR